ncbi:MAG: metal-dependent hydrolase, partial [Escherichia coli]|nr:metal-dependent hydrolase [Escherichia coli]
AIAMWCRRNAKMVNVKRVKK